MMFADRVQLLELAKVPTKDKGRAQADLLVWEAANQGLPDLPGYGPPAHPTRRSQRSSWQPVELPRKKARREALEAGGGTAGPVPEGLLFSVAPREKAATPQQEQGPPADTTGRVAPIVSGSGGGV